MHIDWKTDADTLDAAIAAAVAQAFSAEDDAASDGELAAARAASGTLRSAGAAYDALFILTSTKVRDASPSSSFSVDDIRVIGWADESAITGVEELRVGDPGFSPPGWPWSEYGVPENNPTRWSSQIGGRLDIVLGHPDAATNQFVQQFVKPARTAHMRVVSGSGRSTTTVTYHSETVLTPAPGSASALPELEAALNAALALAARIVELLST